MAQLEPDNLEILMSQVREAVSRMTPDEITHMRHAQIISFAYGNVALSYANPDTDLILKACVEAAGPCPCGGCTEVPK
jgi:hypothetical protein